MTDYTTTYLAKLPQRAWGDLGGDCVETSIMWAMELRGILQGYPAVLLAELDSLYQVNAALNRWGNAAASGTNVPFAIQQIVANGVCRDSLWSAAQRNFDYSHDIALINTAPPANAIADRVNHKLIAYQQLSFVSAADMAAQFKTLLAQGYPIVTPWAPNHVVCCIGETDNGPICFDNRSMTIAVPGVSTFDWATAYSSYQTLGPQVYAIKQVAFTGTGDPQPPAAQIFAGGQSQVPNPPPTASVMDAKLTIKSGISSVPPGQAFTVTFNMQNLGSTLLACDGGTGGANSVRIGSMNPRDNSTWKATGPLAGGQSQNGNRVPIQADIPVGSNLDFVGHFTAPATPGSYVFAWQPVQDGVAWFGNLLSVSLDVTSTPPNPNPPTSWTGTFTASVDANGKLTGTFTST